MAKKKTDNEVLYAEAPKEYFALYPVGNSTDTFLSSNGGLYTLEETSQGRVLKKHTQGSN